MKVSVGKVSKKGKQYRIYLPAEIGERLADEAEILTDYYTLTLISPRASLEQVEHSLEIALDDIRLRQGKRKLREVLKE